METVDVVIVGGGPAGVALSLLLSQRKVKSIILEQNADITEDPRAIALHGDIPRILRVMGATAEQISEFSHPLHRLNFYFGTYTTKPYFTIDTETDHLNQAMDHGLLILQPRFERMLRDMLDASKYGKLRTSCRVTGRIQKDDVVDTFYVDANGTERSIRSKFLVGADGKRGIVRKHFLEPVGIKQEVGIHEYSQTWIAANLKIRMPTAQTHPDFALWSLGYQPDELWDIFWPRGFHFCNHPTTPVATGRFGAHSDRFWRFEYEVPKGTVPQDPEGELWKQMLPYLTIPASYFKKSVDWESVSFPQDCVEIIRCAPALFEHKVVNRWYDGRTIVVGDAAHVFPPFGAQGIASGVRDAFALSWRLGLLCNNKSNELPKSENAHPESILDAWARERRTSIDRSSSITMSNGRLLHNTSWLRATIMRYVMGFLDTIPYVQDARTRAMMDDSQGYRGTKGPGFLEDALGGGKVAQVYLRDRDSGETFLSDGVWWRGRAVLTVLALTQQREELEEVQAVLRRANFAEDVVGKDVVKVRQAGGVEDGVDGVLSYEICRSADLEAKGFSLSKGYDERSFVRRFGRATKFALIRADLIVFSQASTAMELREQLHRAAEMFKV